TAVLNAPYHGGLASLANSPADQWTSEAFESTVTTHEASGVRVLTWGTEPSESERISTDLLVAAVRWARTHHSWVIIDCHPSYDDRTMAMLAASREIFLVVSPEVGPLRNAAQFLGLAREVGLGDMVKVIVNRSNHGIAVADIASANEGTPIIIKFPKEQMSADLYNVARLLTKPEPVAIPVRRRSWWSA